MAHVFSIDSLTFHLATSKPNLHTSVRQQKVNKIVLEEDFSLVSRPFQVRGALILSKKGEKRNF